MNLSRRAFVTGGTVSASFVAASRANALLFHRAGGTVAPPVVTPPVVVANGTAPTLTPAAYMSSVGAGRGSGNAVPAISTTLRGSGWTYGAATAQNFHEQQAIAPNSSFTLCVVPCTLDPFNWFDDVQFFASDGTTLVGLTVAAAAGDPLRGMSLSGNATDNTLGFCCKLVNDGSSATDRFIDIYYKARPHRGIETLVGPIRMILDGTAVDARTNKPVGVYFSNWAGTAGGTAGGVAHYPGVDNTATVAATTTTAAASNVASISVASATGIAAGQFLIGTAIKVNGVGGTTITLSGNVTLAAGASVVFSTYDPTNPQTPFFSRSKALVFAAQYGFRRTWGDNLTQQNPITTTYNGQQYSFATCYIDDLAWTNVGSLLSPIQGINNLQLVETLPQYPGTTYAVTRSANSHLDISSIDAYVYPCSRFKENGVAMVSNGNWQGFAVSSSSSQRYNYVALFQNCQFLDSVLDTRPLASSIAINSMDSAITQPILGFEDQGYCGFINCTGGIRSLGANFVVNSNIDWWWDCSYNALGVGRCSRINLTALQRGQFYYRTHILPSVKIAQLVDDPSSDLRVAVVAPEVWPGFARVNIVKVGSTYSAVIETFDQNGNPLAHCMTNYASSSTNVPCDGVVFDNGPLAGLGSFSVQNTYRQSPFVFGGAGGPIFTYAGNCFSFDVTALVNAGSLSVGIYPANGTPNLTFSYYGMTNSAQYNFAYDVDVLSCAADPSLAQPIQGTRPVDDLGQLTPTMLFRDFGVHRSNSFNFIYSSQGPQNPLSPLQLNGAVAYQNRNVPATIANNSDGTATLTGVGAVTTGAGTVTVAQDGNGWLATIAGGTNGTLAWGSTVTLANGQQIEVARQTDAAFKPDGAFAASNKFYVVVPVGFSAITTGQSWTHAFNKTGLVYGSTVGIGGNFANVVSVNNNVVILDSQNLGTFSTPIGFAHYCSRVNRQIVFADRYTDDYGNRLSRIRSQGLAPGDTLFAGIEQHPDFDQDGATPPTPPPQGLLAQENWLEVGCTYVANTAQNYFHQGADQTAYFTATTGADTQVTITGLLNAIVRASPDKGSTTGGTVYNAYALSGTTFTQPVPNYVTGSPTKIIPGRKFYRLDLSNINVGYPGWVAGRGNHRLYGSSGVYAGGGSLCIYSATPVATGNGSSYLATAAQSVNDSTLTLSNFNTAARTLNVNDTFLIAGDSTPYTVTTAAGVSTPAGGTSSTLTISPALVRATSAAVTTTASAAVTAAMVTKKISVASTDGIALGQTLYGYGNNVIAAIDTTNKIVTLTNTITVPIANGASLTFGNFLFIIGGTSTFFVYDDTNSVGSGGFAVAVGDTFTTPHTLIDQSLAIFGPFATDAKGSGTSTSFADLRQVFLTGGATSFSISRPLQNYASQTNVGIQFVIVSKDQMKLGGVYAGVGTSYPQSQLGGGHAVVNCGYVQSSVDVGPQATGAFVITGQSVEYLAFNYCNAGGGFDANFPSGYTPNVLNNGTFSCYGTVATSFGTGGTQGSKNGNVVGTALLDATTFRPTAAAKALLPTYSQLGLTGMFYPRAPDGTDLSALGANAYVGPLQPLNS